MVPPEKAVPSLMETLRNLAPFRIRNVILLSNQYDSFILTQGGEFDERQLERYFNLNFHELPIITTVVDCESLLAQLDSGTPCDLLIITTGSCDLGAKSMLTRLRTTHPHLPVVLVAFDNTELTEIRHHHHQFDGLFLWLGDLKLLFIIVNLLEDMRNMAHDMTSMGVQCIILIEDSVSYYSAFLPLIYDEVLAQSEKLVGESVNLADKLLRLQARPKILLYRNFEEAMSAFNRYEDHILGIISDMEFPRGDSHDPEAGAAFARMVRARSSDIPLLLQSEKSENADVAQEVQAGFLLKGDPAFRAQLRTFMLENFGFGDFIFRLPNGVEVSRASDIRSFEEQCAAISDESLIYHAERNHFSKWFRARTEFSLAQALRPRKLSDYSTVDQFREDIVKEVKRFRKNKSHAVIQNFQASDFDTQFGFAKWGKASMGGKARGLAFAKTLFNDTDYADAHLPVKIEVPPALTLTTDVFDGFVRNSGLRDFALSCDDDEQIMAQFLNTPISDSLTEALRRFLSQVTYPLAVRSSSMLEDSRYQPFAGIYETYMLPNNHPSLDVRLRHLTAAIKKVYASTYLSKAKTYISNTPFRLEEEKMAVIIQKLVGLPYNQHFYPTVSGVVRSLNYYPVPPMKVQDGIAAIALGFGKVVVEGGVVYRFCPRHPKITTLFSTQQEVLTYSQKEFYYLPLTIPKAPYDVLQPDLIQAPLSVARTQGTLKLVASTFDTRYQVIYRGLRSDGIPFINFSPLLKEPQLYPLAEVLTHVLTVTEKAMTTPVELEFALTLPPDNPEIGRFSLLQVRPLSVKNLESRVEIGKGKKEELICYSDIVLGNGTRRDIKDVLLVTLKNMTMINSAAAAKEIAHFNAKLLKQRKPYILIGFGRWGSNDPRLGIPVTWDQISGAAVLLEIRPHPTAESISQGTHFFQNLTTFSVGYFCFDEAHKQTQFLHWERLNNMSLEAESTWVRHLRSPSDLMVIMNGLKNEGIITTTPERD